MKTQEKIQHRAKRLHKVRLTRKEVEDTDLVGSVIPKSSEPILIPIRDHDFKWLFVHQNQDSADFEQEHWFEILDALDQLYAARPGDVNETKA